MNSPYWLKLISHLSASAIRDYMSCEAKSAYARNFINVPEIVKPISMGAGVLYHWLLERYAQFLWKKAVQSGNKCIGKDEHKKYPRFGSIVMMKMLNGEMGSRGLGSKPETFIWKADRNKASLGESEYKNLIQDEKSKYMGMTYLMLEALRQQFTAPLAYTGLHFEYNIGKSAAMLASSDKSWHLKLHGSIDLVEQFAHGYNLVDYKSGWIISKYKDRLNLIEDIQMSLYWYAMHKILGQPPIGLFIQPLEFSRKYLDEHGPDTLRSLRISLPLRDSEDYFSELMKLAEDIYRMMDMVVRHSHYSELEKRSWVPLSIYGRKAGFAESVVESRFKPRIGPWCNGCQFAKLCHTDHPADWESSSLLKEEIIADEASLPPQQLVTWEEVQAADAPRLFEEPLKKSAYIRKSKRQIRKELLDTQQFVTKAKIMPQLNKLRGLLLSLGTCPCTDMDLFPIWLLEYMPQLLHLQDGLSIRDVCKKCPYTNCPRTQMGNETLV